MPNHNPRLKIWKRVFPGKPLSDVSILEVSIGGSQHLQYSAYLYYKEIGNHHRKSGHFGTPIPNEYMGCVCGRNPTTSVHCY